MSQEIMKIFPTTNDEAHIICPNCGHRETKKASDYRKYNRIKTLHQCKCGLSFQIFIEYRRYSRKESKFWGSCKTADNRETEIKIINISRSGVGFIMTEPLLVPIGERLQISFIFKDTKRSLITKKVIVRRIDNDLIGAEFETHIDETDEDLGYFLST
jgi:predicted RNA-binding Zn-ribbon protein involved in translation (DUF1610 family)